MIRDNFREDTHKKISDFFSGRTTKMGGVVVKPAEPLSKKMSPEVKLK